MGNDAGPKDESAATTHNMSNSPPTPDADEAAAAAPPQPPPRADDAGEASSTITVKTKTPLVALPAGKTDKPRPHSCSTCGRAFARLEHLKRHERSHTKEKPFECPDCKRCFARRDLLLRHQQKLHQSSAPSARPRNNRRESATGVTLGPSRVRKNSAAAAAATKTTPATAAAMRPRANTFSVLDTSIIQRFMPGPGPGPGPSPGPSVARVPTGHSRHDSLIGLPYHLDGSFNGMSNALGQRGMQHGLPKLDTHSLAYDTGLRTAPPQPIFRQDYSMESMFASTSTVNPHDLHYLDSPQSMGGIDPRSPAFNGIPDLSTGARFEFGLEQMLIAPFSSHDFFGNAENAIDGSSPSAMSTASPSGMSDAMIDGSNKPVSAAPVTSTSWAADLVSPQLIPPFNLEYPSNFSELMHGSPASPQPMQQHLITDPYFSTPPSSMNTSSPALVSNMSAQTMSHTMSFGPGPETPTSINGSYYGTSPVSTITDSTRNAILGALSSSTASLNSTLASRKQSFSSQASPLPIHAQVPMAAPDPANSLPSTQDLKRLVAAYLTYFHPHLPFLHIPTLSFELSEHPTNGKYSGVGGHTCLILSMAAIGALYEMEHDQARELFEMAKKMIQTYLEQRRKANVRKAYRGPAGDQDPHASHDNSADTPVWLVQSMLLNVVFGHNCGDKRAGEIASTHCAALVSLAQGAGLLRPTSCFGREYQDDNMANSDEQGQWLRWKAVEERKRTLYTIFNLSSLLVSAYNQPPNITNTEILLDLPCEEEFFEAETSAAFHALGGVEAANRNRITFHGALEDLLRTHERQQRLSLNTGQPFGSGLNCSKLPPSNLKPSAFGCLILINALHNYIWETRQRHHSRLWTNEETERMHQHIEPALQAWQAAWARTSTHSMKRPNPFNRGPLSADAIPLLDLAYVRLFVNLSRSKERFWQRDWDGMAEELARGNEIIQHAEQSPPQPDPQHEHGLAKYPDTLDSFVLMDPQAPQPCTQPLPSGAIQVIPKREKLLRKAGFFAANSLSMADKLNITFADLSSRELPLQSALSAFDCAQVLAEWVATLQDRIGQYLGILGQDEVDFFQMPAIMFLGDEDIQLLLKLQQILDGLENKMQMDFVPYIPGGYAVKILRVTAHILDKAAVWPVTRLMAQCLETHATHMKARAERSSQVFTK